MTLQVPTAYFHGEGTPRWVSWVGATIQAPHRSAALQSSTLPSRVYVSSTAPGSPARMYGLSSTTWITHVDDMPTPDLDEFVKAIKAVRLRIGDNGYVRVKTISFDLVPTMLSIKLNERYWASVEFVKDSSVECGWTSISL